MTLNFLPRLIAKVCIVFAVLSIIAASPVDVSEHETRVLHALSKRLESAAGINRDYALQFPLRAGEFIARAEGLEGAAIVLQNEILEPGIWSGVPPLVSPPSP